jgi:hypothetical protein
MTDKLLWKRGPWRIYQYNENGRLRVDNVNRLGGSQYPILYTPAGRPWHIGWDHPESIPEDVRKKVFRIKMMQESPAVRLSHKRAYGF